MTDDQILTEIGNQKQESDHRWDNRNQPPRKRCQTSDSEGQANYQPPWARMTLRAKEPDVAGRAIPSSTTNDDACFTSFLPRIQVMSCLLRVRGASHLSRPSLVSCLCCSFCLFSYSRFDLVVVLSRYIDFYSATLINRAAAPSSSNPTSTSSPLPLLSPPNFPSGELLHHKTRYATAIVLRKNKHSPPSWRQQ